jgi:hypothetical protein
LFAREIEIRLTQFHVTRNQLGKRFLAISDYENIYEISYRLTGIDCRPSSDYQWIVETSISGVKRNPTEVEHRQHICVGHLVLQREADHVEVAKRSVTFERKKRDIPFSKSLLHIGPRRIHALCGPSRMAIQETVENLEPEMAHANLIGIRET